MKYIRLLKGVFKCCVINEMEYRVNFFTRALIELSYLILGVVMFEVIYSNVTLINGWNKNEMLLLVLMTNFLDSIITFLFNAGLSEIPQMVNSGAMDFIMIKPVNKQFYLTFRKFELSQTINIAINLSFFIYIIRKIPIDFSFSKIIIFLFLLTISIIIMYNIYFLIMTLSFWIVKLFYQLFNVGNKPAEIFPNVWKLFFTYVLPIFISFNYPVKFLVNQLSCRQVAISFCVAAVSFCITSFVFILSLKKYSSVGC